MAAPADIFGAINQGESAELESPEQQSGPYGPENQGLPEELQNALLCLVQEAQRQELYSRRVEVLRDRRNRFYDRGVQHIYEDMQTGVFVQGAPGALVPYGGGQVQCGNYISDYNIFSRAGQIIIAKLSESSPGIDFQPDSGDNAIDDQAAQAAEGYRLLYDRRNDLKDLITSIVRMMNLSGRTVTWTRTIADKQRWGTDEQGQPRHVQTTSVFGTLESKVPILAKSFTECPYVLLTEDPHLSIARAEHPEFADKINEQGEEGLADTQFERLARLGALQGTTGAFQLDAYASFVERKHAFFRPAWFTDKSLDSEFVDPTLDGDVDEEGNPVVRTLRDALNTLFPDGCHVRFVGQQYVGSRNMCLDDELAVDFPYAGEGMSRMAVMDPAIVIQDRFNDNMNLFAEWMDFGAPSTWVRGSKADISAINDQTAAPFCYRALKDSPSRDIAMEANFWREPDPNLPASFVQHTEYLATQLLQFIIAIPSAVQGAGMPDQKTASGYSAALNQALGQLGVICGAVVRLMANVYRQAALLSAKDESGKKLFVVPSPKGAVTIDIEALGKGHFLAHPDSDSGYPESTVQKRATLSSIMEMAAQNPMVAQALFQSPDNWDFFARTFGVPEIVIPEARVRRKQMAEIEILIQQAPAGASPEELEQAQIQHAAATMTAHGGAGPDPGPFDPAALPQHSSIQPAPLDYHEWEFEECKEKLSDWPWVQQQVAAGNQAGIDNLRLHAMEHQQYIAQAQAAAAQMQAQSAQPPMQAHKAKPGAEEPKPQPEGLQA